MANTRIVQGRLPLLLDDPTLVRTVQSGKIALFAVRLIDGVPEGERHYLFDVEPGAALLGVDSKKLALQQKETDVLWGLLAVAVEPTEVEEHPIALDSTAAGISSLSLSDLRFLIEDWVYKLATVPVLPKLPTSKSISIDPNNQYLSLVPNQIFQPPQEQVLWVQCQHGTAQWLGFDQVTLSSQAGLFALTSGLWILASSNLQLTIQPLDSINQVSSLLEGLAQLHYCFLRSIEQITSQEAQIQAIQFQKRQQLNQQIRQGTLKALTSLLQPQSNPLHFEANELLMVVGAVGKALGVSIAPPMEADNSSRLRDPLEAIAHSSRLRLRRVLLRDRWWQKDGGPIVAYTRHDKHPVALLPVAGDHYELYDPRASSIVKRHYPKVDAATAARLNPSAYIFYRPFPPLVLRAWDLIQFASKGQLRNLLLLLSMGIASTLAGMLVPVVTGVLIDTALPTGDEALLLQIGVGLLFSALGTVSLNWVQALATMRLETQSEAAMQAAVWDRLLMLSPSFFRQYTIGDLESRVSGISQIRRTLTGTTLRTILTGFFSLLNFGLMLLYSVPLALIAGAVALVAISFTGTASALLLQQTRLLIELRGEISGVMVRLIEAVPKLRSAGAEERAFATWGKKYQQQLQLELRTQWLQDSVAIFNTVMPGLSAILLFWMAVSLMGQAHADGAVNLSTGDFLAFSAAFGIFLGGATSLSNTITSVLEAVILWKRSQPILAAEPEIHFEQTDPGKLQGSIQIDRVTFRYREDGPLTLDQVSLKAEPGEFIALVGPSGSGKSTLFRLLLGFDTPSDGSIYYDGQDLAGLDVAAVRRQLGVVLQNSRINSGSIFDNIAASALITVTEAWAAAEMAGFADDVRAMPMGMHTFVSEGGSNLSGGQRQRLMIARALALKPQILLFDEATSALDNQTQAIVTKSLDNLGVTRIVIAHRLSTIRHADRIYVIQSGQVVQQGTFDELAQQSGLFAGLIARQISEQ